MEIQIAIPVIVLQGLEFVFRHGLETANHISSYVLDYYGRLRELVGQESPIAVPIMVILIIFWPVILSFFMVFTTASTWVFWLVTSVFFGLVQLVYVTYHFCMIGVDILGLSLLKTYAVIRSNLLYYVGAGAKISKKSQRLTWKKKLEGCSTYDDYLKIAIQSNNDDNNSSNSNMKSSSIERHRRSNSYGDLVSKDLATPTTNTSASVPISRSTSFREVSDTKESFPPSPTRLPRTRSFSFVNDDKHDHDQSSPHSPHNNQNYDPYGLEPVDPKIVSELGEMTTVMLMTTKMRLKEARQAAQQQHEREEEEHGNSKSISHFMNDAISSLKVLLSGVVKRNHLTLENLLIRNARSVANSGQYGLSSKSRKLMHAHFEEVEKGLDWIAEAPVRSVQPKSLIKAASSMSDSNFHSNPNDNSILSEEPELEGYEDCNDDISGNNDNNNTSKTTPSTPATIRTISSGYFQQSTEITDRMTLVRKMKQNMGRTALMLSGGGAQAMYHLGTIRALVESKVYNDITVISGTSGGSISAAMCAIKKPEELLRDVCVPWVSTDYKLTGEMKKYNIRWFPKATDMAAYWFKTSLMVNSAEFRRTCEFYYSDITFEEAFERTGKHVCITVSASRASGGTAQRLLLNHISTPHVTLASAVAASCALPGVMAPAKLFTKNSTGKLEPFEVDGVEWIDGSVQADIPFQRISTLFNVSNYIVCQTNFHVIPLLNKAHHPTQETFYWRFFQTLEWDIRNRVLQLSRLGLFPKVFGQDVSKVFKQKYHGNLTLVPRFTPAQTFGLKALMNPTVDDMKGYLKYGQMAAWPYLNVIRDMIRLEKALDDCLSRLQERFQDLYPDIDFSNNDELESIASSSLPGGASSARVRFGRLGSAAQSEKYQQKLRSLEKENSALKQQIRQLQQLVDKNNQSNSERNESTCKNNRTGRHSSEQEKGSNANITHKPLTEAEVWNAVMGNK